jgi:ABC-type bacteriocin/lantibiotic exporter with double-glycine peptidase domain
MVNLLQGRAMRTASRLIGFPPRTGELLDRASRLRLVASLIGSLGLAGLELLGVMAILPLMQFIADMDRDAGALGVVHRMLGSPSDEGLLAALAGLVIAAFVLKDIASVLFRRWQVHFMADQEVAMSTQVLGGYLTGPYRWHTAQTTGDKVFTVEGAVAIGYSAGLGAALAVLTEIVTIVLIIIGLAFVSPWVTLGVVIYFAIGSFAIQRFIRPRIVAASERATRAGLLTSSASLQALGAAKEVKLRRAAQHFVRPYFTARHQGAHVRASASVLAEIPKYILEIMFVSAIGVIALVAMASGGAQDLFVTLGVFVAAGTRLLPSAVRLIGATSGIKFAREPLRHLVEVIGMQRQAASEESERVITDHIPSGDIRIRDLRFTHEGSDVEVLRGVDLDIPAGRATALVGSSGAGKTTLVDILLGLHQPTSGSITAGGVEIFDNLPGWQRQLAVVPQEVYLMDESLADNITFDLPRDDGLLADCLRRAQLTDLVAQLPHGLDTTVGERGARLSGGQRQRIGIARALYRQPSLLVLDEATSALDNETEKRLTETIDSLKGSLTLVIVAHRLSTVRNSDQLVFMTAGRVSARGTFDEVAATNAEFANLVRLGNLGAGGEPA